MYTSEGGGGRGKVGAGHQWLVGQGLDMKSKLCPDFVQSLSRLCPSESKVQGLSNPCLTMCRHVQSLSKTCTHPVQSKVVGQTLDMKIQDLSRNCPIKYHNKK